MIRILSCHFNLLPYHGFRYESFMSAYGEDCRLNVFLARATKEYELFRQDFDKKWHFNIHRLQACADENLKELRSQIFSKLKDLEPDVILLLGGYAEKEMLFIIDWAEINQVPLVLCSETKRDDARRLWPKEILKKYICQLIDSFFVGGTPHRDYAISLGAQEEAIFIGYDVVDNNYFSQAIKIRENSKKIRKYIGLKENGVFLTSNRFVERKNIGRLIKAYQIYRDQVGDDAWDLVLLGDGPHREEIEKIIDDGSSRSIFLKGFVQVEDLPKYYGVASCFVHPAVQEQWGLVVNEAMAAGLPILISDKVGCRYDLIKDGVNGFLFKPNSVEDICDKLLKMHNMNISDRQTMGLKSSNIISEWGGERFADGLYRAISYALKKPLKRKKRNYFFDRIIFRD